jgi:hypothetical protein
MIRRRRRNAQANLAFIQPQPGNQFGNNGGSQPFPPQYPPQAYNSSPYVYDPATGFAPVRTFDTPSLCILIPISDYILLAHQLSAALRAATWRTSNFVWGLQGWCNGLMSIGVIFSCPGMGSLCNVDCDFCCLQTINKVFVQYCKHYANLCNFDQTRVLTTYLFTNIVARLDMAACA